MADCDDTAARANCEIDRGDPDPELLARMEAAVLTLPRFTREVFLAHRVHDLSYTDIAAATGVSVRRVEREIALAIVGIDRALTEQQPRHRWWCRRFRSASAAF